MLSESYDDLPAPTEAVTSAAAAGVLGVHASVIRSWMSSYGFPTAFIAEDGRLRFRTAEISALRDALETTPEVAAAVAVARATTLPREP